ncbi:MAG: CotH kinase family protein [Byssovorax sp.]
MIDPSFSPGRALAPRRAALLLSLVFLATCSSKGTGEATGTTSGTSTTTGSGGAGGAGGSTTATGTGGAATTTTTTAAGTGGAATTTGAGGSTGTGTGGAGTGGSAGTGGAGGVMPPTWPKPCADLYDQDKLPSFELTFTPQELAGLDADCGAGVQSYRPVKLTYEGETVDAMVRMKGNWSWNCQKKQFIVSFNEQNPQGRFHGLRKLVFDAPWYDRTLLHERMSHPFFKKLGLPYSCANNAKVTINGQYYGVYANLERLDKEYLQRNFVEDDGNLYQGGAELKTNLDINDTSDIQALNAAATVDQIDALMDLDEAVAEWSAEAMLPAMDNYWAGVEINYYIYHHPSRGFVYLPYDMDIVFGDSAMPNGDLIWPDTVNADPIKYQHPGWLKEPLMKKVLADPFWCGRFVQELVKARAAYVPAEMAATVDLWNAQIAQAVSDDTHKTFSTADHDAAVTSLKSFFAARAAVVDAWLAAGNHCPAVW